MAHWRISEQSRKIAFWSEILSSTAVEHQFENLYGRHNAQLRSAIHGKFLETGYVLVKPRSAMILVGRGESFSLKVLNSFFKC